MQRLHIVGAWDRNFHEKSIMQHLSSLVCELVTSTKQIRSAKTALKFSVEMQLSANSNKINNASSSDNKPSSTFSWLLHLSIGNQKPFQTNHSEPYVSTESKAKCHSPFSWLLDPSKCIRRNCSDFWLTFGLQMPFQIMDPTNTSQAALPYWQCVSSLSNQTKHTW